VEIDYAWVLLFFSLFPRFFLFFFFSSLYSYSILSEQGGGFCSYFPSSDLSLPLPSFFLSHNERGPMQVGGGRGRSYLLVPFSLPQKVSPFFSFLLQVARDRTIDDFHSFYPPFSLDWAPSSSPLLSLFFCIKAGKSAYSVFAFPLPSVKRLPPPFFFSSFFYRCLTPRRYRGRSVSLLSNLFFSPLLFLFPYSCPRWKVERREESQRITS